MSRQLTLVLGATLTAGAVLGATLESLEVTREDGVYRLHAETMLAASPEAIHKVLTDYDRFDRISSVYKEHGYLDPEPDGTQVIYTTMEGCLIVCKSLRRVERLEVSTPEHIRTVTIPERSDFKQAMSEWFIDRAPSGSHVTYRLVMEPDFWVPPVIGPLILKHKLKKGGGDALDRIEGLAQEAEQLASARQGAQRGPQPGSSRRTNEGRVSTRRGDGQGASARQAKEQLGEQVEEQREERAAGTRRGD